MASVDAKNVAKELLESIGKGKKVVLGKIIKKNGYAQNTADNPLLVTGTKSFKEVVDPVVNKWLKLRDKLTQELENKDLTTESMRDITNTIDTLTKNIQLLTGGKTENSGIGELAETINNWINKAK